MKTKKDIVIEEAYVLYCGSVSEELRISSEKFADSAYKDTAFDKFLIEAQETYMKGVTERLHTEL